MSYTLLTSLYYGEGSNADLTSRETRAKLHVATALEEFIPRTVSRGLDVILTGNPGDGKSHLVRTLQEAGALQGASVVLDLSAQPSEEVLQVWTSSRAARRPFVLCANEGPLLDLLERASGVAALRVAVQELRAQLGHLVAERVADLPSAPQAAVLVDLADRSVLEPQLIERALAKVCSEDFLPDLGHLRFESSAGRNLLLLKSEEPRRRLARVLTVAGQRCSEHITFRQLWAAVAFAVTGAKTLTTLRSEISQDEVGLGTYPLDNLTRGSGKGLLLEAVREFGDPATVTDPELDEQLWAAGKPSTGEWLIEDPPNVSPAATWAEGRREEALVLQAQLKRLVALAHERGAPLVEALMQRAELLSSRDDAQLVRTALTGLRALYLAPSEEDGAPSWLLNGLPLWLGFSYQDVPAEERPHVAVSCLPSQEFHLLRPVRAPWLSNVLGPLPEVAWLAHGPSGVSLRLDADLLVTLQAAAQTSGPMDVPEPVQRFISRLAGWEEAAQEVPLGGDQVAVLRSPRGPLQVTAATRRLAGGGVRYV